MRELFKDKVTQDFVKTSFGNILEWYDFAIYGLFAIQISSNFFPAENRFVSLLMVFLTFAVGFIARPFGAIIFGRLGDKFGKNYAVNISIWCMAIPTSLIGILPNYYSIGVMAPLILIVLRIFQGLSAGGQFSGLIAIAVDSGTPNKPFLVSLVYAVSIIGSFVASLVGFLSVFIVHQLHTESLFIKTLTWRVPFVLSGLFFLIYLKLKPDFSKHAPADATDKVELTTIFKQQPRELITLILLSSASLTIYYVLFTYLITYMQIHLGLSKSNSFSAMNIILFSSIFLYPSFGYFAGNIDCRINSAQKMTLVLISAALIFSLAHINLWFGIVGLAIMIIAFCAITAYTTSLFAEVFASNYRMTACSFSFNAGVTISGFAPLIAELFSKISIYGLACFIILACFVMWFSLGAIKKTPGYQRLSLK